MLVILTIFLAIKGLFSPTTLPNKEFTVKLIAKGIKKQINIKAPVKQTYAASIFSSCIAAT